MVQALVTADVPQPSVRLGGSFGTVRLWDDGTVGARQARAALTLHASLHAEIPGWPAPVFRM